MKITFRTIEPTWIEGSKVYGFRKWTVEANSIREAWDKIREITHLPLEKEIQAPEGKKGRKNGNQN